jgi:hypothetical protein
MLSPAMPARARPIIIAAARTANIGRRESRSTSARKCRAAIARAKLRSIDAQCHGIELLWSHHASTARGQHRCELQSALEPNVDLDRRRSDRYRYLLIHAHGASRQQLAWRLIPSRLIRARGAYASRAACFPALSLQCEFMSPRDLRTRLLLDFVGLLVQNLPQSRPRRRCSPCKLAHI